MPTWACDNTAMQVMGASASSSGPAFTLPYTPAQPSSEPALHSGRKGSPILLVSPDASPSKASRAHSLPDLSTRETAATVDHPAINKLSPSAIPSNGAPTPPTTPPAREAAICLPTKQVVPQTPPSGNPTNGPTIPLATSVHPSQPIVEAASTTPLRSAILETLRATAQGEVLPTAKEILAALKKGQSSIMPITGGSADTDKGGPLFGDPTSAGSSVAGAVPANAAGVSTPGPQIAVHETTEIPPHASNASSAFTSGVTGSSTIPQHQLASNTGLPVSVPTRRTVPAAPSSGPPQVAQQNPQAGSGRHFHPIALSILLSLVPAAEIEAVKQQPTTAGLIAFMNRYLPAVLKHLNAQYQSQPQQQAAGVPHEDIASLAAAIQQTIKLYNGHQAKAPVARLPNHPSRQAAPRAPHPVPQAPLRVAPSVIQDSRPPSLHQNVTSTALWDAEQAWKDSSNSVSRHLQEAWDDIIAARERFQVANRGHIQALEWTNHAHLQKISALEEHNRSIEASLQAAYAADVKEDKSKEDELKMMDGAFAGEKQRLLKQIDLLTAELVTKTTASTELSAQLAAVKTEFAAHVKTTTDERAAFEQTWKEAQDEFVKQFGEAERVQNTTNVAMEDLRLRLEEAEAARTVSPSANEKLEEYQEKIEMYEAKIKDYEAKGYEEKIQHHEALVDQLRAEHSGTIDELNRLKVEDKRKEMELAKQLRELKKDNARLTEELQRAGSSTSDTTIRSVLGKRPLTAANENVINTTSTPPSKATASSSSATASSSSVRQPNAVASSSRLPASTTNQPRPQTPLFMPDEEDSPVVTGKRRRITSPTPSPVTTSPVRMSVPALVDRLADTSKPILLSPSRQLTQTQVQDVAPTSTEPHHDTPALPPTEAVSSSSTRAIIELSTRPAPRAVSVMSDLPEIDREWVFANIRSCILRKGSHALCRVCYVEKKKVNPGQDINLHDQPPFRGDPSDAQMVTHLMQVHQDSLRRLREKKERSRAGSSSSLVGRR